MPTMVTKKTEIQKTLNLRLSRRVSDSRTFFNDLTLFVTFYERYVK